MRTAILTTAAVHMSSRCRVRCDTIAYIYFAAVIMRRMMIDAWPAGQCCCLLGRALAPCTGKYYDDNDTVYVDTNRSATVFSLVRSYITVISLCEYDDMRCTYAVLAARYYVYIYTVYSSVYALLSAMLDLDDIWRRDTAEDRPSPSASAAVERSHQRY